MEKPGEIDDSGGDGYGDIRGIEKWTIKSSAVMIVRFRRDREVACVMSDELVENESGGVVKATENEISARQLWSVAKLTKKVWRKICVRLLKI